MDGEIVALSGSPIARVSNKKAAFPAFLNARKLLLRGTSVAKYIVGQERRLVDPPSQVVAGVRTVTTKMNGRCDTHVAAPIRFFQVAQTSVCDWFQVRTITD